jgi:inorganic triphosphatase YgiF
VEGCQASLEREFVPSCKASQQQTFSGKNDPSDDEDDVSYWYRFGELYPNLLNAISSKLPDGAKNESESSSLDSQSSTLVAVRSDSAFWIKTAKKRKSIDIYETAARKNEKIQAKRLQI